MKTIRLDGEKLYWAFYYGKKEVIKRRKHLNKINVFPVADGDTGTNLAMTMQSIIDGTTMTPVVSDVSRGMAEAALMGSRGNSGIIFAQFLWGLSEAVRDKKILNRKEFAHAMKNGVEHAYRAMKKPVEGTILTVMKAWSNALSHLHEHTGDFVELLSHSLETARTSLRETPKKLKVLEKAGVVDAGAQGFVHFLEGMVYFLRHGRKHDLEADVIPVLEDDHDVVFTADKEIDYRYCTEAILRGKRCVPEEVREAASPYGDSLIVAGAASRVKVHIHTNQPADLFSALRHFGDISHPKVDDMLRQRDVQFHRKASIALVTDSACDLPQEIFDRYQIHVVPLNIAFGESQYLDKITLTPDQFYSMLDDEPEFPRTSQPVVRTFEHVYSRLMAHYDSVVSIHLSRALSGTWNAAYVASQNIDKRNISVIDSKNLSTALGLIVLRVAQDIQGGKSMEEVARTAESLCTKARVLVSVKTLKYMVRGGRVSPLKGILAKALNLKPIVSLNEAGETTLYGKAFSTRSNIKKILKMVEAHHRTSPIQTYAIGHAHAQDGGQDLAERLHDILGFERAFTMNVSPAIGAHAGIGCVSVAYLSD